MEKNLPKRKPTRLKNFDYSTVGAYFVTICTRDRMRILSDIVTMPVGDGAHDVPKTTAPVGDGAHDVPKTTTPVGDGAHDVPKTTAPVGDGAHDVPKATAPVGDGTHDVPKIKLSKIGEIVKKNLLSSNNIPGVKIDQYIIMPDHIHAIIILDPRKYNRTLDILYSDEDGTSKAPSPTNQMLPHVISVFKKFCNKEIGYNIFQRGYYDHIIRDKEDYETRRKYIYENPMNWYYDR